MATLTIISCQKCAKWQFQLISQLKQVISKLVFLICLFCRASALCGIHSISEDDPDPEDDSEDCVIAYNVDTISHGLASRFFAASKPYGQAESLKFVRGQFVVIFPAFR